MYCIDYNNNHKVSPNRILLHSFACNIKDLKSDHSQHLRRYTPTEKVYTPTEKLYTYWEGTHLLRRSTLWLFELDLMALPAKSHWLLVVCLKILKKHVKVCRSNITLANVFPTLYLFITKCMKSPQGRVHQGRAPWDKPSLHAQPDLLKIIKKREAKL